MPDDFRALRLRVGSHVQRLRRAHELSQEQLAELADTGVKHIGQVERGEANVGLETLANIATALSVDASELFVPIPRRRRRSPPLFLVNGRELDQLERIARSIRSARVKPADGVDE